MWFSSSLQVLDRDENGAVRRVIGAAHPIQLQKEAETKLRDATFLLEQGINAAPVSIICLDAARNVISINRTARHVIGGVVEKTPFPIPETLKFGARDGAPLNDESDPIARALNGEAISSEIYTLSFTREDMRHLSLSSASVSVPESDVCTIITLEDVTETERQRQQLDRANRLDALGQLTGGIAHDFNNLLGTISFALDHCLTSNNPQANRNALETAKRTIDKGSDLTARLLAFARSQPGTEMVVSVSDFLEDIQQLATRVIEESVQVEVVEETKDLWVFCDPSMLENAVMNLLINARDAIVQSGKGDRITIAVRGVNDLIDDAELRGEFKGTFISGSANDGDPSVGFVDIAVSDNGPGMTDDVKRQAVDPFFSTKDRGMSSGLGLSMVYGFISHAKGELRIYSEPGQGTTIRLLLARHSEDGSKKQAIAEVEPQKGQGECILLVEDEGDLRGLMVSVLELRGYTLRQASSGKDAIDMLKEDPDVDLMITDVVMPGGIGGFELAKLARAEVPDLPIIYMSGFAGFIDDAEMTVHAPIVRKPVPPDELAAVIRSTLGS